MKFPLIMFVNICLVALIAQGCHSQDKALDRWETKGPSFALRVTEFEDSRFPLSKFKYVFEAKPDGSDEWREIMTANTDDDTPIPREQVRFISNQVTYVFMTDQYAVTTDEGRSWSIWKANDHISNVQYPGQFVIKEVLLNADGNGTLTVTSRSADEQTRQFQTGDFGRSWAPK